MQQITVSLGQRSYPIEIGPGLLREARRRLEALPVKRWAVIADDNTAAKRHQHIFTFKFILNQKFIKIFNCCQRFALFTGRKNKMTGSCTVLFYNMLYLFKVKICHMAVCYDAHLSVFDHQIIQRFTKCIKILRKNNWINWYIIVMNHHFLHFAVFLFCTKSPGMRFSH